MSPKLKSFLIISAKHAVNAVLVNSALMLRWSGVFHLHSWSGVLNLLEATGIVVASSEAAIWVPKIIAWSNSSNGEAQAASAGGK